MYAQMFYMVGMGVGFLFIPNVILPVFGLQTTDEVWIRILGALVVVFSGYYFVMIKEKSLPFFRASTVGRYVFCASLVAFVLLGLGEKPLYLFVALETGLAIWTHMALRKVVA